MTKGIKHKDIGEDLSRTEFEADDSHELEGGTSFPGSPTEKDRFYRTDLHKWYIWNGTTWKYLGGVDISDANAAVGDVLSGKTFYSVAEPRKTGTLTLAEDKLGGDMEFVTTQQSDPIPASSSIDLIDITLTAVTAGSIVLGFGGGRFHASVVDTVKVHVYIGGVQAASTVYLQDSAGILYTLEGSRTSLSGNIIVKLTAQNYDTSVRNIYHYKYHVYGGSVKK